MICHDMANPRDYKSFFSRAVRIRFWAGKWIRAEPAIARSEDRSSPAFRGMSHQSRETRDRLDPGSESGVTNDRQDEIVSKPEIRP